MMVVLPESAAEVLKLTDHLVSVGAEDGDEEVPVLPVMCNAAGVLKALPATWKHVLKFSKDPKHRPAMDHFLDLEKAAAAVDTESSSPEGASSPRHAAAKAAPATRAAPRAAAGRRACRG